MPNVFNTPAQIDMFRLIAVKNAMKLYINTGMKVNRMYTPANMMKVASQYTGKQYGRNSLKTAYDDLCAIYNSQVSA